MVNVSLHYVALILSEDKLLLMKKVLFIDYFFAPLATPWRGVGLARFLPEFAWQPIVLTAAQSVSYDKDYSSLLQVPAETQVYRVGHYEIPWLWQYMRTKLKISVDFPDAYKAWYRPAYQLARQILRQEKIDLICSTSPTFVTAMLAMQLKREFGLPWVADFQDGWAVNDFLNVHYRRALLKPLWQWYQHRVKRAEAAILAAADKITVVHWHIKQRWVELYGIPEDKVAVLPMGYDESAFIGLEKKIFHSDRLTVTFLGSFYPDFEEPFRSFLRVMHDVDKEAEALFIGRGAIYAQQLQMPNLVCMMHLSQKKALSFALNSDFLSVVMPPYGRWTPSKTFDYLRLGKPILALVPDDGDTARLVHEARAGFVLSFDESQMKKQLGLIFEQWRRGELRNFGPDGAYVAQFERRKITERMVQVFEAVVS